LNQASGTENIFVSNDWGNSTAGDFIVGGPFRVNLKSNLGGTSVGAPAAPDASSSPPRRWARTARSSRRSKPTPARSST